MIRSILLYVRLNGQNKRETGTERRLKMKKTTDFSLLSCEGGADRYFTLDKNAEKYGITFEQLSGIKDK